MVRRTVIVAPEFTGRLRELRLARAMSYRDFRTVSRAYVHELETGRKRPTPEIARALDTELDAGGALAALVTVGTPAPTTMSTESITALEPDAGILSRMLAVAGPVDGRTSTSQDTADPVRRVLLGGIAAMAAAAGLSSDALSSTPRRIGLQDVVRLETMTDLYRSFDYEQGGGALYAQVADLAESATSLLETTDRDDVFRTLTTALAGIRQLAGWTAFDAGRYADSQRHFLLAERVALAGGDRLLAARVRYCQARQFQHQRHNIDALHTLRFAHDQLGSASTPAVDAMLHGARAASHAALGDSEGALDALGRARDAFERIVAEGEPSWMRFYDYGELLAQYGRVYRDLARADRRHGRAAVEFVTEAVASFGPTNVRSTVLNQVGLCSAWFLAGEPEQALTVGYQVLAASSQLTSRRILERITNIRRDIGPHRERADVAEFEHVLAAA